MNIDWTGVSVFIFLYGFMGLFLAIADAPTEVHKWLLFWPLILVIRGVRGLWSEIRGTKS